MKIHRARIKQLSDNMLTSGENAQNTMGIFTSMGFIVVIITGILKALAQQTANPTGDISEKIANVQGVTKESVSAITAIVSSVADGIAAQSATTQDISSNVVQAAQGVQEINENVNQTSVVSTQVSSAIQEENTLADEMATDSTRVDTNAVELANLAGAFNVIVAKFHRP